MTTTIEARPYETAPGSLYAADVASTELMGVEDARKKLGDRVLMAEEEELHTVITRHGQPAAVLVDMGWYQRAREALGDPTDIRRGMQRRPRNRLATDVEDAQDAQVADDAE